MSRNQQDRRLAARTGGQPYGLTDQQRQEMQRRNHAAVAFTRTSGPHIYASDDPHDTGPVQRGQSLMTNDPDDDAFWADVEVLHDPGNPAHRVALDDDPWYQRVMSMTTEELEESAREHRQEWMSQWEDWDGAPLTEEEKADGWIGKDGKVMIDYSGEY